MQQNVTQRHEAIGALRREAELIVERNLFRSWAYFPEEENGINSVLRAMRPPFCSFRDEQKAMRIYRAAISPIGGKKG